ncbi:hypothetical protein ACDN41_12330 [Priestia aryabhattai]|uniref:hypothetical protein n=1 Tax=Priestia aryabhattai TaxID=412384 RepID=UPI003531851C
MTIEVWYDQYTNSWVSQVKDAEGNQVGNADYVHSKREALKCAQWSREENKGSVIKVFKRNGELQKEM